MIKETKSVILIALTLGCCLALANHLAEPIVKTEQQAFEKKQLQDVLGTSNLEVILQPDQNHHLLQSGEKIVGKLEKVTTNKGYNGEITFWLATRQTASETQVIGVRVIRHEETPGLGDKLDLQVSDWVTGFNGKSLANAEWDVKKYGGDFDQFSGATITPRAVVLSIAAQLAKLGSGEPDKQP